MRKSLLLAILFAACGQAPVTSSPAPVVAPVEELAPPYTCASDWYPAFETEPSIVAEYCMSPAEATPPTAADALLVTRDSVVYRWVDGWAGCTSHEGYYFSSATREANTLRILYEYQGPVTSTRHEVCVVYSYLARVTFGDLAAGPYTFSIDYGDKPGKGIELSVPK